MTRAYHKHVEQRITCPRCGQTVYKSAWPRHDRDCASIVARFGSTAAMITLFRKERSLQIADLAGQLTGVSEAVVRQTLLAQGVTREEIATRDLSRPVGRRCRRCKVVFGIHGARRGAEDPSLCSWCDGSAPDGRAEPDDGADLSVGDIWRY